MANTIWKEVFLIMCSSSKENAWNTERFPLTLRITDNYTLPTLCCAPHNVGNDEGKMNGLPLNRAVYSEPENVEMSYPQLKAHFRQAEKERNHTTGYIVFTDDSFDKPYTEEQRTYVVSSNNKAFIEGMGGYSIYASSLDGSDKCVRLEAYMADEHGGKDGWKIEKCYVKDDSNREMLDIIAGKFFIAYAPIESEKFLSMPKELARKYEEKFKYPERFYKSLDGIEAKPYKPVSKDMER